MKSEKQVVLLANPNESIVSNVKIVKKEFIPVDDFFDFTELFVDNTNEPNLVEAAMKQFDEVWKGNHCHTCGRKAYCPDHIAK